MKRKKMSKADLARAAEMSRQNLHYILKHPYNINHVGKIAKALDINPKMLLDV
jgi:lambda repressor-like predicted transcriptional regulator